MNLRNLLLSMALAGAACSINVPNQFPCKTVGSTTECGKAQVCGADLLCTNLVDCQAGQTRCNGNCVDLADPLHCGNCDTQCKAGETCGKNSTGNYVCSTYCAPGQTACQQAGGGFVCKDLSLDRTNCGACLKTCNPGEVCSPPSPGAPGQCGVECLNGLAKCGSQCVNTDSDAANCGACGNACAAGTSCVSGTCKVVCPPGLRECTLGSGICIDTTKDRDNCGGCGNACAAGQICTTDTTNGTRCTLSCQAGLTACSGTCVDMSRDRLNCGACGHSCSVSEDCNNGACVERCPAVFQTDGGAVGNQLLCSGVCTDVSTDRKNCGACGTTCADGEICVNGVPTPSCAAGLKLCGTKCIDIASDLANCGDCGVQCGNGQSCVSGQCKVVCPAGMTECAPGVCVDTSKDLDNCGGCSSGSASFKCPAGQICSGGGCVLDCPAGSVKCNGACVDSRTFTYDPGNCGGCGQTCGPYGAGASQATAVCTSSSCSGVCPASRANCNNDLSDGCEVDLTSAPTNCGACGNVCKGADNAAPACSSSTCGTTCQSGFADCDSDHGNGCESSAANDAANCGGCGAAACGGATPFCVGGACNVSISGVQQNVSIAQVVAGGWTQCWPPPGGLETYSTTGTSLASITAACSGAQVMVACKAPGASVLTVAAAAATSQVLSPTGSGTRNANGVAWYFDGASSIGFAPQSAVITRAPCDISGGEQDGYAGGFGSQRLCWPTQGGALVAGARCGDHEGPSGTSNYERLVFTK